MLSPDNRNLAANIQSILRSSDFATTDQLVFQFARAVKAQLDATQSSADRQAVLNESLDYLTGWAHLSRVLRSHIASRLQAVTAEAMYSNSARGYPIIQFDA